MFKRLHNPFRDVARIDVSSPTTCLLQIKSAVTFNRLSMIGFLNNEGSEVPIGPEKLDIGQYLVRNARGPKPILDALPDNIGIDIHYSEPELRRMGWPPFWTTSINGGESLCLVTDAFRKRLETMAIDRQEFHPVSLWTVKRQVHYPAKRRVFRIGEGWLWRPLDVIDVVDFEAMERPVWYDDAEPDGAYRDDVDPAWPTGSFWINPKDDVPLKPFTTDRAAFWVRGVEGIFAGTELVRAIQESGWPVLELLRQRFCDKARWEALWKLKADKHIARLPPMRVAGTPIIFPSRGPNELGPSVPIFETE